MPDHPQPRAGIGSLIAAAFRRNLLPCLLLNTVAVLLVISYYRWPAAAGFWQAVGDFKLRWSFAFSFGSTVFAAVLLPTFLQWVMGTLPEGRRVFRVVSLALFWGFRGMEIDLFYQFQGWLFGHGHDAATLAKKVAMDQFIYSVLWAVPTFVIALRWVDNQGSWQRTREGLDRNFWTRTYPSILFTNWLVWIPAVALIYSLPAPLQFPLFSIVMCFFILVVTLLARAR